MNCLGSCASTKTTGPYWNSFPGTLDFRSCVSWNPHGYFFVGRAQSSFKTQFRKFEYCSYVNMEHRSAKYWILLDMEQYCSQSQIEFI